MTERLVATESKRPLPAEPKADHYAIMGRALWAGERDAKITLEAMTLFKKGLDLDPNSVPALQGYARAKISAVFAAGRQRTSAPCGSMTLRRPSIASSPSGAQATAPTACAARCSGRGESGSRRSRRSSGRWISIPTTRRPAPNRAASRSS